MVGQIAQAFLTENALAHLNQIIPQYQGELGGAANWADEIKPDRANWGFAYTYHFITSHDSPSAVCYMDEDVDCADQNCVIGAIANYTSLAQCNYNGQASEHQETAVKFLTHFIGDISMPLHNQGRLKGGNDNSVIFNNQSTIDGYRVNLHAIWDHHIPRKLFLTQYQNSTDIMASDIVKQIQSGQYKDVAESWISSGAYDSVSDNGNSLHALDWSKDANKYNCMGYIWEAWEQDPTQDFAFEYYEKGWPLAKLQIAKAGYRMAHHFNSIFDTCPEIVTPVTTTVVATTITEPTETVVETSVETTGPILSSEIRMIPTIFSALVACLAFI
jgi:hypothetical protein